MSCKLKKNTWGPTYISKTVWWYKPMFDFGIFCHLLRLMGIYRVGPPSGYLTSFVLPFLFFLFFFFFLFFPFFFLFYSSFSFFLCLSLGAHLAPGPLDIVHPWVATPLLFHPYSYLTRRHYFQRLLRRNTGSYSLQFINLVPHAAKTHFKCMWIWMFWLNYYFEVWNPFYIKARHTSKFKR